ALADALRLSDEDRDLLRRAAKVADGSYTCLVHGTPPARSVRPTVRAMLDRIAAPAFVLNQTGDLLAWTDAYERLATPLGILETDRPNLLRYVFTDPRARVAYPEWDRVADEQVVQFRSEAVLTEAHAAELAGELTEAAGAAFSARLEGPPRTPLRAGVERLVHPEAGDLRLMFETLDLPADEGQRLVVLLPGDEATATALDRLAGRRPGALRAVSG
ncbi:MAG TPA: transcriptional regulator, partial [Thermomonospora sp.]|nr:transcriptional regulator [Thermomonospora sp.]